MRILTYKRTHTGDPDNSGRFGMHDCMGQVRDLNYEAVIGIGGTGSEPRSHRIDGKITWVGIGPRKSRGQWSAAIVTFDRFLLFDAQGPMVASLAPRLAKRMYDGKVRYLLVGYSPEEQREAEEIVNWVRRATRNVRGERVKVHKGVKVRCVCRPTRAGGPVTASPGQKGRTKC